MKYLFSLNERGHVYENRIYWNWQHGQSNH